MKRITFLAAFLILLATAIYSIARQSAGSFVPVTDVMLENPDPADWLMWRRTLNSWGYSPLDQINATNVRNLRMLWTRGMGPGIQEANRLYARPANRRVSVGQTDCHAKRCCRHRRRNRPGANQSGDAVQRGWRPALHLSDGERRKEFSSRCLQSADQHDVLRAAECVCDGDGNRKYSDDVLCHPEQ